MRSGCFCRPRYWVMLCLLAQVLTGCMMLGQDSPQSPAISAMPAWKR
jgi:hypothetical protein